MKEEERKDLVEVVVMEVKEVLEEIHVNPVVFQMYQNYDVKYHFVLNEDNQQVYQKVMDNIQKK